MRYEKIIEALIAVDFALQPGHGDLRGRILANHGLGLKDVLVENGSLGAIEIDFNVAGEVFANQRPQFLAIIRKTLLHPCADVVGQLDYQIPGLFVKAVNSDIAPVIAGQEIRKATGGIQQLVSLGGYRGGQADRGHVDIFLVKPCPQRGLNILLIGYVEIEGLYGNGDLSQGNAGGILTETRGQQAGPVVAELVFGVLELLFVKGQLFVGKRNA